MEAPPPERSAPAPAGSPGGAPASPLAFAAVVLGLHLGLGAPAQGAHPIAGLAWSQVFAFLLPAAAAAAGKNLDPARFLLLRRRPRPALVGLAIAMGLACVVAAAPLVALWSALLPGAWVRFFDLGPLFRGPPAERALLVAVSALLAPLCEEVAFRGYLLSTLRLRVGDGAALAASTLLFAAMHLDPVRLPALLLQGAALGWLALRSGSIWPAVAAHAANNLAAATLASLDPGGPDASPEVLPSLILLAMGCLALAATGAAFDRRAPPPPPPGEAAEPRDPAAPVSGFSRKRLPRAYLAAAALGMAALLLILGWRPAARG